MTEYLYSAVQYDQVKRPEPWQEPTGIRRLIWKLRGSKRPAEPFVYYDSLRHAFNAIVQELEVAEIVPVGSIRILHDWDQDYLVSRVVVDMELDGHRATAPAIPSTLGEAL